MLHAVISRFCVTGMVVLQLLETAHIYYDVVSACEFPVMLHKNWLYQGLDISPAKDHAKATVQLDLVVPV